MTTVIGGKFPYIASLSINCYEGFDFFTSRSQAVSRPCKPFPERGRGCPGTAAIPRQLAPVRKARFPEGDELRFFKKKKEQENQIVRSQYSCFFRTETG
jgi:hypothetical protein